MATGTEHNGLKTKRVAILVEPELEERVHHLRGSGRSIRSFSAVGREALARGLELMELEARGAQASAGNVGQ